MAMNAVVEGLSLDALRLFLAELDPALCAAERLKRLIGAGLDRLPRPGGGSTLSRWQALAAVAASDLSLVKLYEGHTDALATLSELQVAPDSGGAPASWGLWAAESPGVKTIMEVSNDSGGCSVRLHGTKAWCSGATAFSHALMTAWYADGRGPQLVWLNLQQDAVRVVEGVWQSVGMRGSASSDVVFDGAVAHMVGEPGDYLKRPGFWHGGAGIAACWYGGTLAIAHTLRQVLQTMPPEQRDALRLAALGRIDVSLQTTAALLRSAAEWIDANPAADARAVALRLRLTAEHSATLALHEAGRALGATPFCRDARFARAAADLPVFIRQSHADRDLAALGGLLLDQGAAPWQL